MEGIKQNALVPTYHCMHTPGGPLKYSLEGHQFAIFAMKLTSDNRSDWSSWLIRTCPF